MRWVHLAVVLVAMALVPVSVDAGADEAFDGELQTPDPVLLAGQTNTQDAEGVQAAWEGGGDVGLSADRITVVTEFQEGQIVRSPAASYRQVEDEGRIHRNLSDVAVAFQASPTDGELLVDPSNGSARVAAEMAGHSQVEPLAEGTVLGSAGFTGPRAGTEGDFNPGYEARANDSLVAQRGKGPVVVEGTFDLFVNNVTIGAEGSGESLDEWAGYREEETSPGVAEYELRVVVIEVEGGRLQIDVPGEVGVLDRNLTAAVDGTVAFSEATGEVGGDDLQLRLANAGLTVQGSGRLQAQAAETGSTTPDPGLNTHLEGSFEVLEGPITNEASTSQAPAGPLSTGWWLAGFGLASLVSVGGFAAKKPSLLRPLPARLREPLYRRWRRKGVALEEAGAFGDAARTYRRMRALFPRRPDGWYRWARAQLEAKRPLEAVRTVSEAEEVLEAVPLDLLEVKVAAAWEAGEEEAARQTFAEMFDRSPEVARGFAKDLGLPLLSDDRFDGPPGDDDGGGLKGYV